MNANLKKFMAEDAALPPHDEAAEQGVLGCVLMAALKINPSELAPNELVRRCLEKFQNDEVFYDLRHLHVWQCMTYLTSQGVGVDTITVQAELRVRGILDSIGGIHYLSALQDMTPSVSNLDHYVAIVWEKFITRKLLARNVRLSEIAQGGELNEQVIASIEEQHRNWTALLTRGAVTPKYLKPAGEFMEEYFSQWFDRNEDTYGYGLPFEIKLRLRPSETTLMTGDNGSGKSTMLCWLAGNIAKQMDVEAGEKVVIASMEMPCHVTLFKMARQLLGFGPHGLARTTENELKIGAALAWLNRRVVFYDFLGITNKNDLLLAFDYAAAKLNGKFFILDNMMKVGIADDDYASQGQFIQRVCEFNMKHRAHTMVVVHENKGEGSTKQKVRGSKQLTDAPDNVVGMQRNEKKATRIEELKAERAAGKLKPEAYAAEMQKQEIVWDSKFTLNKQRNGEQQNASKWLYFEKQSHRFNVHFNDKVESLIPLPTIE